MEGLRVKLFTFLMSFVTVCVTKVTFCLRAQVKCFHMFGVFFFVRFLVQSGTGCFHNDL
jgi:hypothetical protein